MVGALTVSLGLGLATLTASHMLSDSDARCSPRSSSHIAGIESPFGYKASTHTVMSQ